MTDLKAVLADWRYYIETGGIVVDGVNVPTDRESRAHLTAEHAAAVRKHVETCFAVEKIVSDLIDTEAVNRPQEVQDRFMNGMAEMASE